MSQVRLSYSSKFSNTLEASSRTIVKLVQARVDSAALSKGSVNRKKFRRNKPHIQRGHMVTLTANTLTATDEVARAPRWFRSCFRMNRQRPEERSPAVYHQHLH